MSAARATKLKTFSTETPSALLKCWWRCPLLPSFTRAGQLDLDPARADLRRTEFPDGGPATAGKNLVCWRRSALRFAIGCVSAIVILKLLAAIAAARAPAQPAGSIAGLNSVPNATAKKMVAALKSCNMTCMRVVPAMVDYGAHAASLLDGALRAPNPDDVVALANTLAAQVPPEYQVQVALATKQVEQAAATYEEEGVLNATETLKASSAEVKAMIGAQLGATVTLTAYQACTESCLLALGSIQGNCSGPLSVLATNAATGGDAQVTEAAVDDVLATCIDKNASATPDATRALDLRFQQFQRVYRTISTLMRSVALLMFVRAALSWRDLKRSRKYAVIAYIIHVLGFVVINLVPWYRAMGFPQVIDELARESPTMTAQTLAGLGAAYRVRVALNAGLIDIAAVMLTIVPSVLKAASIWKLIVPESSLWYFVIMLCPVMSAFINASVFALPMQMVGSWWLWGYCILTAVQLLPYAQASKRLREMTSPDTTAARKVLNSAKCCYFIVMIVSYICLVIFIVDLLRELQQAVQYVAEAAGVTLEPNPAELLTSIIDIDALLIGLFEFYVSYYLGVAVWVDLLSYLVIRLHRSDGAYRQPNKEPQQEVIPGAFAGIASIVAVEDGVGDSPTFTKAEGSGVHVQIDTAGPGTSPSY